jgi:hypothetical protein
MTVEWIDNFTVLAVTRPCIRSVELREPPYFGDGSCSFEMCSCGFEFGFDDDPGASAQADSSVQANWDRWRQRFIGGFREDSGALAVVLSRLEAIGVRLDRDVR